MGLGQGLWSSGGWSRPQQQEQAWRRRDRQPGGIVARCAGLECNADSPRGACGETVLEQARLANNKIPCLRWQRQPNVAKIYVDALRLGQAVHLVVHWRGECNQDAG